MSIFNSQNTRIRDAQTQVLGTLMAIPAEYGAVFVIDQDQAELTEAVRANVEAQRLATARAHAAMLAKPTRRGRRRARVVVLSDWAEVAS